MLATAYKSPLHETVSTTKTDYWNDSCSVEELTYAIDNGAVGATTNPTIVLGVLKKEMPLWKDRIYQIIAENPTGTEDDITWQLIEEMAIKGAELLKPVYDREQGLKGRISIQTNPTFYRDAEAIAKQAVHFSKLAPNMMVKIPVTNAGVAAIEEATYEGVDVNATVCFSVPQSLAVAEAIERGLNRRAAAHKPVDHMRPVCTIMIGRLDDWIHVLEKRDSVAITPGYGDWAGIAAIKLPTSALRQEGQSTAVWVYDPATSTVKSQVVQIATADGNDAVVAGGLTPGMQVVATGVHVLSPGQKVTVYQPKVAQAPVNKAQTAPESVAMPAVPSAPATAAAPRRRAGSRRSGRRTPRPRRGSASRSRRGGRARCAARCRCANQQHAGC